MRILLHEHFSSRPPGSAPAQFRRAGRAIVESARRLLGAVVGVETMTAPPSSRAESRFRSDLRRADAALVIAPEGRERLARLARAVERSRVTPIGCGPVAARLAGDKLATARHLVRAGIATPPTRLVARGSAGRRSLARAALPLVLKPRDGCGSSGVEIVRWPRDLAGALARARRAAAGGAVIVQPYVPGVPLSVTLLVSRGGRGRRGAEDAVGAIAVVAVGRQILAGRRSVRYVGGEIPIGGAAAAAAARVAVGAAAAIAARAPDLRGPLGVDLVAGREGPVVIEINPRPTSSFIGLSRIAGAGFGRLLLDAARGRPLPLRVTTRGRCRFSAGGRVTLLPRRARHHRER